MPTIRFLTPADFADMCDIIDKHSSAAGAWFNDRSAPATANFRQLAKDHAWLCFTQPMSNFWGYFDDAGKLVAWVLFNRWLDLTNITLRLVIEDPDANLPRADGAIWSDAAIDLVNWGVGYFWSEGIECFWARLYLGRESFHVSRQPNCLLSTYEAEAVLIVPAYRVPPEGYRRVSWAPVGDHTMIYKFKDPLPLAAYEESFNDPT
ncbi:hypothetical protein V1279_003068 [Bradyrhizobium sp. AZCC 1610]|uniref:hypothetical protein n=1 Tax=Bradyrhizobium sp. AZCC 1610 TaxID=3117020 RepID=UPI002FEF24F4